jgi:hypothetical protein
MPLICYEPKKFSPAVEAVILQANEILEDYARQGYDLTLRQLYYQFVSRGIIANRDAEYKRLGSIVNDARLAGRIDWDHITDRTRNMRQNSHWTSPQDIIDACAKQYQINKWSDQPNYVEVWVEKDALVGVLEVACKPLDVAYFSCRGYTSQSEMWAASQRLLGKVREGKTVNIIHLGDHDPSGIDMTRDITDRLTNFLTYHGIRDVVKDNPKRKGETEDDYEVRVRPILYEDRRCSAPVTVNRIALTMAQIEAYDPPPNPAKITDSRAKGYIEEYGDESWELDALEPAVLTALIEEAVKELRDDDLWEASRARETEQKQDLEMVSGRWEFAVEASRPENWGRDGDGTGEDHD